LYGEKTLIRDVSVRDKHSRSSSVGNKLGLPKHAIETLLNFSSENYPKLPSNYEQSDSDRIILWDILRSRRVGGTAAPFLRNLRESLMRNPHFTIYALQDNKSECLGNQIQIILHLKQTLQSQLNGNDEDTDNKSDSSASESNMNQIDSTRSRSITSQNARNASFPGIDILKKLPQRVLNTLKNFPMDLSSIQITEPSGTDRVMCWDSIRLRRVAGNASPFLMNLVDSFSRNLHFNIYTFQDLKTDPQETQMNILAYFKYHLNLMEGEISKNPDLKERDKSEDEEVDVESNEANITKRERESSEQGMEVDGETYPAKKMMRSLDDLNDGLSNTEQAEGLGSDPSRVPNQITEMSDIPEEAVSEDYKTQLKVFEPKRSIAALQRTGGTFFHETEEDVVISGPGWWEDLESGLCDTTISPQSLEAAIAAAAVVCHAVDGVFTNKINAYDAQFHLESPIQNISKMSSNDVKTSEDRDGDKSESDDTSSTVSLKSLDPAVISNPKSSLKLQNYSVSDSTPEIDEEEEEENILKNQKLASHTYVKLYKYCYH
jgi:hypothetical protein